MPTKGDGSLEEVRRFKAVELLKLAKAFKELDEKRVADRLTAEEKVLFDQALLSITLLLDPKAADRPTRREHIRVQCDFSVDLGTLDQFQRCYVKNISGGGLFIHCEDAQPVGTKIVMRVNLPDEAGPMDLEAVVVWSHTKTKGLNRHESGMGVRFLGLEPAQASRINLVVHRLLQEELKRMDRPKA